MTIEVDGVPISLDFLPYLIKEIDGATIITKNGRVLTVERVGSDIKFTNRTYSPPLDIHLKP